MTPRLRSGVSFAQTDYGLALLDERQGTYWQLNPTGAQVLRALLDGRTAEQAVRELTAEYAIDDDSAHHDVQELLTALFASGLLVREEQEEREEREGSRP
ncbi:lasso peptide biosynthesis PqqD family chaperone [Streptomyces vilmorinianum]|uniref:lasso peptide biosynthesis PqqD family chaperone n=1 Tax=Streptomyces vilmorinianum TaxID=3051092 RepID=UPI0010FB5F71|nr:lasso peptide biosynthesis PqqD family chaperone [Streptomyces vilmorinianum]